MSDISVFQKHQQNIAKMAGNVLAFTAHVPLNEAMDAEQQAQAITHAAMQDPMFESVDPLAVRQIAVPWAASVRGYIKQRGSNPPFDLLANAYHSMSNLIKSVAQPNAKFAGDGAAMLESAAKDMSTSQGVLKQAIFMAMVLPSQLGAATGDMCTFMPVERDENKFYEIYNIAGTNMGSFKKGQRMDQLSSGVYSQMGRIYMLDPATVDGTLTEYTIKVADQETRSMPIKAGRVRILVDRVIFKSFDDGDGNINVNEEHPKGATYVISGTIDYTKGEVTLTFKDAPAAGTKIAIQAELDVENAPDIIPVINQAMKDWMMKPSQYILAAEHTVQGMMELQREFGQDLASMQFTSLTQWASHEIDMKRLRKLAYHTIYDYEFDTALPEGQVWESWCGLFKNRVNAISRDIRDRTLKYGIRGGFAGGEAATFIKSLPSSLFTPAPGYVESSYVQFMGTLFGVYRIFEVPSPVCQQMSDDGYPFDPAEVLFYSRGDNLGEAGMVSGDAIPAIPFTHPTTPGLVNRQTLWGSSLNEVHPRNGHAYFARLLLTNKKAGALNPVTGDYVGKTDGGVGITSTAITSVAVESVSMSPKTKTTTVGSMFVLTPAFVPADATNQNYTLVSSDASVVKVNANGELEAVGTGTADVTLTTEDGGFTAVTKVTVNAAV
ncbi:Ig-like domain-containing protein [Pantoea sp. LMR881]|uniref:Ig-like domain-containing protein n=1 Tax=Pantoea sp. LMR881 TaxID=3014336 RepID=UPI0022B055A0|nr:Ig-like domain-containing protein [Pantoea sp. LMR881]MCZ4061261.1 Ig-like domain-containing protein [Pantoea sp. LMR881]